MNRSKITSRGRDRRKGAEVKVIMLMEDQRSDIEETRTEVEKSFCVCLCLEV